MGSMRSAHLEFGRKSSGSLSSKGAYAKLSMIAISVPPRPVAALILAAVQFRGRDPRCFGGLAAGRAAAVPVVDPAAAGASARGARPERLLAQGLSGVAVAAASARRVALGLRRRGLHRPARREPNRGISA